MKFLVFALLIVGTALVSALPAEEKKYTSKYDNVDIDEILNSDRLLRNYVACLKGTGNCSPSGTELKRVIPDALNTECSKCSAKQKEQVEKVLTFLIQKKPETWSELSKLFDPTGEHAAKYEDRIKKAKTAA